MTFCNSGRVALQVRPCAHVVGVTITLGDGIWGEWGGGYCVNTQAYLFALITDYVNTVIVHVHGCAAACHCNANVVLHVSTLLSALA